MTVIINLVKKRAIERGEDSHIKSLRSIYYFVETFILHSLGKPDFIFIKQP